MKRKDICNLQEQPYNKWFWIWLSFFTIFGFMSVTVIIVNENPFEISVLADDNVVEVTDNFRLMSEAVANAESELVRCETKLDLYNKSYGDFWKVSN